MKRTLGIIGGGQLGRMMAMAAARLDFDVVILDPMPNAPASQVANEHVIAAYDDVAALTTLAKRCHMVTYEFENVPAAGLEALNASGGLAPGPRALWISQDRLDEKQFLESIGLATAPYRAAEGQAALISAAAELSGLAGGAIIKTRRMGYDGKGQVRVSADRPVPANTYADLGSVPLIVEGLVDFEREISVIGARSAGGDTCLYDPAHNTHVDGVLARSVVPSGASRESEATAKVATTTILNALEYVGVIGVEFFVTAEGSLTVNEFAPRVHNSGHWTEAACLCSQFEQHVRAVMGLPLGNPTRHSDATMENLLGNPTERSEEMLAAGDWMVHLYGKAEARPGRKMGHATRLDGLAEADIDPG